MNYEAELIRIIKKNEILMHVMDNVSDLQLDTYYIGAGCIVQSVWNELTNRPTNYGISDIDLIYFNNRDISFEAENEVIVRGHELFSKIILKVDIKNQARVHKWYQHRFGIKIKPYQTIEEAIDTWPTTATALGVRKENEDNWKIYAPYGLKDVFDLTIRANKTLVTEDIYMNKANKWKEKWPELNIISWNQDEL